MAKSRPLREDEILANIANEARLKDTPKPTVIDPVTGQLREVTVQEASSFGVPIGPSRSSGEKRGDTGTTSIPSPVEPESSFWDVPLASAKGKPQLDLDVMRKMWS